MAHTQGAARLQPAAGASDETAPESLEAAWRVQETAAYLVKRGFGTVTLQFADDQLDHASRVAVAVQAACAARGLAVQVYVLADTTYNPLSVDEVAAAHVGAQCVVHYGRASLTKLSRLPAYFVFPEQQLDAAAAAACLAGSSLIAGLGASSGSNAGGSAGDGDGDGSGSGPPRVLVFLDQPLLHLLDTFRPELLQQVAERHGQGAAERLAFPAVPRQHLEPAEAQQHQVRQQPAAGGCCGGGSCADPLPQKEQQQQQAPVAAACCQGNAAACTGSAPAAAAGGNQAAAEAGKTAAAELAAAAAQDQEEQQQDEPGSSVHSLAGYEWRLPAGMQPRGCGFAWVGSPEAPALLQLQLTYSGCPWAVLDTAAFLQQQQRQGQQQAGESAPAAAASSNPSASSLGAAAALQEGLPLAISRTLRRRYFLVEKTRDASIVGILVGTLGAAGYGDAVAALRAAAAAAGKKSYTLLMGKPSPAKLANFPEIEVFVLVADPQGAILDSKEYLAPIITPHEAMLAWGGIADDGAAAGQWDESQYRLDFDGVVQQAAAAGLVGDGGDGSQPAQQGQQQGRQRRQEPRFSLLAGGYVGGAGSGSDEEEEGQEEEEEGEGGRSDPTTALALHAQQALQVTAAPQGRSDLVQPQSAADYLLHKRTWQGVETPLVGAAPKAVEAAVEGRAGRAAGYADEPAKAQQAEQQQGGEDAAAQ